MDSVLRNIVNISFNYDLNDDVLATPPLSWKMIVTLDTKGKWSEATNDVWLFFNNITILDGKNWVSDSDSISVGIYSDDLCRSLVKMSIDCSKKKKSIEVVGSQSVKVLQDIVKSVFNNKKITFKTLTDIPEVRWAT
jgi:hypothetical protein